MIKKIFLKIIDFYQKRVSPLSGNSCRYYPTCSEYGKWQFEKNRPLKALFWTTKRVLTCNHLFEGGFDYPIVKIDLNKNRLCYNNKDKKQICVEYFLIPYKDDRYYLIKKFKGKEVDR